MFSSRLVGSYGDLCWFGGHQGKVIHHGLHSFSSLRCRRFVLANAYTESGRGDVVVNREEGKLD